MFNESRNSIDDSSESGLGRHESASPSNAPGRDARGDSSDDGDDDDEEEIDGTKTQSRV